VTEPKRKYHLIDPESRYYFQIARSGQVVQGLELSIEHHKRAAVSTDRRILTVRSESNLAYQGLQENTPEYTLEAGRAASRATLTIINRVLCEELTVQERKVAEGYRSRLQATHRFYRENPKVNVVTLQRS
jgi:hypothetical protein